MKRVVDWISTAYEDIQNLHATWRFLRNDFSFPTIVNTQEYMPTAVSVPDLAEWIRSDIHIYKTVEDESSLEYYPWETFRRAYQYGSRRTHAGRPSVVTVKPNNALVLWPIPNDVYTITGEYYKSAHRMVANDDVPIIPVRYHMIIVWRGLMHYGSYAGAEEKYVHGNNEFRRILNLLEHDQLEALVYGEPLA